MAEISASTVMKLRKMSGQGMMDCKKALQEAEGDVEQAMEILRKKGLATLAKRAERETTEGAVVSWRSADGKAAALATVCCETDFVAKSDDFRELTTHVGEYIEASDADQGADAILKTSVGGKTFEQVLTDTVSKTGEKTEVGDYTRFHLDGAGLFGLYVHFNGKVGSLIQIGTSDDSVARTEPVKQAASDIAMHVTASKPLALDRDGIDPEVVAKEKEVYAEMVKNKPPEIIERIVEGKMKKFYAENCLLDQPFVKDDSKTVRQVLAEAARQGGGEAKIERFVRLDVG
jgi:elongation factor Ts